MSLQQAQLEGLCLRFPETLPLHPSLSYETALNMLLRAVVLSNQIPYHWGYIDKPAGEGHLLTRPWFSTTEPLLRGASIPAVLAASHSVSERRNTVARTGN